MSLGRGLTADGPGTFQRHMNANTALWWWLHCCSNFPKPPGCVLVKAMKCRRRQVAAGAGRCHERERGSRRAALYPDWVGIPGNACL